MIDRSPFVRGPGPARRRGRRTPPAPERVPVPPTPLLPPAPTYWWQNSKGRWFVCNPNECLICGHRPHADTAHHDFAPAMEPVRIARRLGWPIPEEPTLWL